MIVGRFPGILAETSPLLCHRLCQPSFPTSTRTGTKFACPQRQAHSRLPARAWYRKVDILNVAPATINVLDNIGESSADVVEDVLGRLKGVPNFDSAMRIGAVSNRIIGWMGRVRTQYVPCSRS